MLDGELAVIEIITPMKYPNDIILKQLYSVDPVSRRRHRHKPVAHFIELSGTVVGPHIRKPMGEELFNLIISRYRLINQSVTVEFVTRKGVKSMEPVQKIP